MVTEKLNCLCTGCGVCVVACPKKCLDIQLDSEGFYKPVCDETSCVHCGLCDKICPKYIEISERSAISSLSVVSMDEETLMTTSSGGLCYEIAKAALSDGKKICGCIYNYETHRAEHTVIDNIDDLERTKGSKYIQSYTADAFSKIFDGCEWVVFGTPCQIAGIDAMANARKCREKLLLVDFFCHGTPSMNLWKKYISENGGQTIEKIDFRSKEFGWHNFSYRFTYKGEKTYSDNYRNMFYQFFFGNYCLGEACYSCKFKAMKSVADIRVGDFWGDKYRENKKGVSCCVPFTEKGERAIRALSSICVIRNENTSDVLEEQMTQSPKCPLQRKIVLKRLKGKKSLKTINNTTLFFYRLKCKIKSVIMRKM